MREAAKLFGLTLILGVLTACVPSPGGSVITSLGPLADYVRPLGCGAGGAGVTIQTNLICSGLDLISGANTQGVASSNLRYAETDQFDLNLNASMQSITPISVAVDDGLLTLAEIESATRPTSYSKRIIFWLAKIRDTKGENIVCVVSEERGLGTVLIGLAVNIAIDQFSAWRMYAPAKNYNSRIFVKRDNETQNVLVTKLEFLRRDSNVPLGCPEA